MYKEVEKGQMLLWKLFYFFNSTNYVSGLALNLLHLKYWENHMVPSFAALYQEPIIMNEEVGEMCLSVLTRKLKGSNSSHYLKQVRDDLVLIPTMNRLNESYQKNFQSSSGFSLCFFMTLRLSVNTCFFPTF